MQICYDRQKLQTKDLWAMPSTISRANVDCALAIWLHFVEDLGTQ